MKFYQQTSAAVINTFNANLKRGITQVEATKRKAKYGLNQLQEKTKISPLVIFFNQFKSFIIYILMFAIIISIISGEHVDALVILIILLFNAFFGFFQEYKAEKAIEALKHLTALKATVLRNGKPTRIDTKDIVPGDILILAEGDKISADARLIHASNLKVAEASLTGESVPVEKQLDPIKGEVGIADQKNMVFSGTLVTMGAGKAVVTSTGMHTQIGKIAGMINEVVDEMTPLQEKLQSLGKWIGTVTIIICILVFIAGVFKENLLGLLFSGQFVKFILASKHWFLVSVSLAVAAVPEGLPAIVTIALALGVRKMVKRNALIRKLPSVETLGETTVICSDKTGTLTRNEMTVVRAFVDFKEIEFTGNGYSPKGNATLDGKLLTESQKMVFRIGALCNDSSYTLRGKNVSITGDPTEAALLVSAAKVGINYETLQKKAKRLREEPFDSIRKLMSTVNIDPGSKKHLVQTKGAPEILLKRCNRILLNGKEVRLTAAMRRKILNQNNAYAKKALRVLGFAYKVHKSEALEKNMVFVGLQCMIDPPRIEVKESIAKCHQAGIRVIMITGDNRHTASAVAKEIGILGKAINGVQFSKMTRAQKKKAVQQTSVFARVEPAHKMEIVDILEKQGQVVAMTGDGVNDAPALKKADMGIAMGIKGTDVSKEASDMVLEDDKFDTIVNAIEEGRGIYENITKFVNYLLSCNLGEVLVIFIAIILGLPLPMTAIMLLWMNLVTDGLPALALSVDPNPKDVMKRPPRKAKEGIMNKSMIFNISYVSVLITAAVLGLFIWGMVRYASFPNHLERIQTIAFTSLVVMELVRLQAIRSEYKLGIFSNKYLIAAILASLGLQLLVIYTPLNFFFGTTWLSLQDWVMIVSAAAIVYVINMAGVLAKHHWGWFSE